MNTTYETLINHKNEILQVWEGEVRRCLPGTRKESHPALIDNIPLFLDSLAEKLKHLSDSSDQQLKRVAKLHGTMRVKFTDYTIEEAISEYNILRKVIFSVLEKNQQVIPALDRDYIYEAIDIGLTMAASEYNDLKKKQLSESKERFKLLFKNAPVGMAEINTQNMNFIRVNPAFCQMLGYPEEELLEMDVYQITHPDDIPGDIKIVEEIRRGKRSGYNREKRYLCKNGSIIWVEVTATYHVKDMRESYNITVAIDITERKKAEKKVSQIISDLRTYQSKLESSTRQLQMITDIQPLLIGQLDKNYRYVFVNEAYEKWFKTPRDKILGRSIREILGEEFYGQVEPYLKIASEGNKAVFEMKANYKGTPKIVQCTYSPGYDENGEVDSIYISVIDITDLRETMDSQREETILRQKFMSTLSHDLRTPLTAAKMSADLMVRKVSDESDKKMAYRISENLKRVNLMIEDLLDVSKIRAGQELQAELQEFDLSETVQKTIEDLISIYGNKFSLQAPEKLKVYLDPNGIRRILENLCGNAIKYGSPDEKVNVHVTQEYGTVLLAVKNKGNPLINVDKDKIFQPFQRGPENSIAGKKGWGIGLTIVKGLTAALKGKIDVVSNQQETIFTVKLPLDARDADQNQSYFQ